MEMNRGTSVPASICQIEQKRTVFPLGVLIGPSISYTTRSHRTYWMNRLEMLVSLIFRKWDQIAGWLRRVAALRTAARHAIASQTSDGYSSSAMISVRT